MNEAEQNLLRELVLSGMQVFWIPDEDTAKKVLSVTKRADEFCLCANFSGGEYAALDNAEMDSFAIVTRLKRQVVQEEPAFLVN
jgi:hypothetical protein